MDYRICLVMMLAAVIPVAHSEEAIFLIRHTEEVFGVEDPPLTDVGRDRAMAWAAILRTASINAVYTSQTRRSKQSGELIAEALNVPVESVPREEVARLIGFIRTRDGQNRVLIVTHKRQMPRIFRELGLSPDVSERVTFSYEEYGNLFIFVPREADGGTVMQLRY